MLQRQKRVPKPVLDFFLLRLNFSFHCTKNTKKTKKAISSSSIFFLTLKGIDVILLCKKNKNKKQKSSWIKGQKFAFKDNNIILL